MKQDESGQSIDAETNTEAKGADTAATLDEPPSTTGPTDTLLNYLLERRRFARGWKPTI